MQSPNAQALPQQAAGRARGKQNPIGTRNRIKGGCDHPEILGVQRGTDALALFESQIKNGIEYGAPYRSLCPVWAEYLTPQGDTHFLEQLPFRKMLAAVHRKRLHNYIKAAN